MFKGFSRPFRDQRDERPGRSREAADALTFTQTNDEGALSDAPVVLV